MGNDPRAENCRAVVVDGANLVRGVELAVDQRPAARWELVRVELIDEATAGGNTVANCAVLDADGIETAERVWLAWPWPGLGDGKLLPGNPDGQHMIRSSYTPPDLGPLALYVGNVDGAPDSDVVGGLGLPWNRHVSFLAVWRERRAAPEPGSWEPLPEHEPELPVGLLADKVRWWLEESLRADEAGDAARAQAIRYSLVRLDGVGLMYRLENALKSGAGQG